MAFSLSSWFKGKPGAPGSENPDENPSADAATPVASAVPVAPPSAVRTVVPNSVQPVSLRTPGSPAPRPGPVHLPVSSPPAPAAPTARVSPMIPAARGKISFGSAPAAPGAEAPAAAPAPAPAAIAEATVSLEVGDFLDRLPPSFVQAGAVDRHRRVDFRTSELYSDLAKGRASVPASVIYQKCPELFTRPVSDEEDTEISLPLQKLVEQMSAAFRTRTDQVAEENVGEIETPFLQVALEDSARLPKAVGTTAGALRPVQPLPVADSPLDESPRRAHRTGQISTISSLKPAPEPAPMMQSAPTAQTAAPINAAKRPPSTVRASVAGGKIRLSGPSMPNRMVPVSVPPPAGEAPAELPPSASQRILPPLQVPTGPTASPSHQVSKKTARIQIPPISLRGPGAPSRPASPAVPVQSSPVPVRPGPSAELSAPPISFRSSPPPPPGVKPMPHSFAPPPARPAVPPPAFAPAPAPAPAAPAPAPAADDRKISLSLAAILRGLPLSSLTVEPNTVPDDVRVTLPFSLVEPQLAQGRVAVPQAVFAEALPGSHREVLASNSGLSEIPLPLQEVFQNLPPAALAIRQDQTVEEVGHAYPTPFSQKADEDAQRFGQPAAEASAAVQPAAPEAAAPAEPPAPETPVDRPLPADPVAEEEAPAPAAAAVVPAEEPIAEAGEEAAPSEEFAHLFVEESAPARDIPLDFSGDKPFDVEEPPVEAKAPVVEKPEPAAPEAQPEPSAAELKPPAPAIAPEEKPAESAEPKPAAQVEEKPAGKPASPEAVAPLPAPEAKHEEPAAERTEEPKRPQVAPAAPAAANGANGHALEVSAPVRPIAVPAADPQDSVLQSLFMTEDEMDAKTVVRLVSALPGLEGCAIMFEDGLQLAGNFPSESDAEGFSAMAPPFFKRTRNFTGEINLGALHALTLHTERGLVSFFMHAHICLSVRHSGRGFLPGVREKLEAVTRELARMYATTAQAH